MIGLRSTLGVGLVTGLVAAAVCGVADQMRHIHNRHFWDTPGQVGIIAAALYFVAPLIWTVLFIVANGRVSNRFVHNKYTNAGLVVASAAVTFLALEPFKQTLRIMPSHAGIPIAIVTFLVILAILGGLTRSEDAFETASVYALFFPQFRGPRVVAESAPTATVVRDNSRVVSGTYISSNAGASISPRAKGRDWDNGGGGYDDTRDRNNEALALKAKNDAAYHANQARLAAQNKAFFDRVHAEERAKGNRR